MKKWKTKGVERVSLVTTKKAVGSSRLEIMLTYEATSPLPRA